MLLDVQVATPHPKKSVSSVQMGQLSARAAARRAEPLPGLTLEVAVQVFANNGPQRRHRFQHGQRFRRIASALQDEYNQVLFGLSVRSLRNEEGNIIRMSFERSPPPTSTPARRGEP